LCMHGNVWRRTSSSTMKKRRKNKATETKSASPPVGSWAENLRSGLLDAGGSRGLGQRWVRRQKPKLLGSATDEIAALGGWWGLFLGARRSDPVLLPRLTDARAPGAARTRRGSSPSRVTSASLNLSRGGRPVGVVNGGK
jgi:hypothetical protein